MGVKGCGIEENIASCKSGKRMTGRNNSVFGGNKITKGNIIIRITSHSYMIISIYFFLCLHVCISNQSYSCYITLFLHLVCVMVIPSAQRRVL